MANDADELLVAANGSVYVGPTSATLPEDIDDPISGDFTDLGFVSEDGVAFSPDMAMELIRAWQSFYPVRRIVKERDATVSFELLQWKSTNVILAFGGGSVTEDFAGGYTYNPPAPETLDTRALIITGQDGDKNYRLIFRKGLVTELGETMWNRGDASKLPVSFGLVGGDVDDPWFIQTDDPAMAPNGS